MESVIKEPMSFVTAMKKWLFISIPLILILIIFFENWSFFFKRKIIGEVVAVERVTAPLAFLNENQKINPQVFSFSVAIKDRVTGEIHMASSEDRQWAAVTKGNCVIAAYFPYPPWRILDKGQTNHNARLLRNFINCEQVPNDKGFFEALKFFFLAT